MIDKKMKKILDEISPRLKIGKKKKVSLYNCVQCKGSYSVDHKHFKN